MDGLRGLMEQDMLEKETLAIIKDLSE